MAKRTSGGRRRTWARAIKRGERDPASLFGLLGPGKAGRRKGSTDRTQTRMKELRAYLIWAGRPDLSDSEIIRLLHRRDAALGGLSDAEIVKRLHKRDADAALMGERLREQIVAAYKGKKDRTLRRDIAAAQREIWGDVKPSERKDWGRIRVK